MILLKSLLFLLNITPLYWEIKNDTNGDEHPNYDWERRMFLCSLVGVISAISIHWFSPWWEFLLFAVKYSVCCAGIFSAIFPYWVNYVHLKKGIVVISKDVSTKAYKGIIRYHFESLTKKEIFIHVVSHLSDSAIPDKWKFWRKIGWVGRLIVYAFILTCSSILWFK